MGITVSVEESDRCEEMRDREGRGHPSPGCTVSAARLPHVLHISIRISRLNSALADSSLWMFTGLKSSQSLSAEPEECQLAGYGA